MTPPLLCIKPAIYGREPADIYNYAKGAKDFPHKTTMNQFFTERQFESYRKLGFYIAQQVFGADTGASSRGRLIQLAKTQFETIKQAQGRDDQDAQSPCGARLGDVASNSENHSQVNQ